MRKELSFFKELDDIKAYVLKVAYSQFASVYQRVKNKAVLSLEELVEESASISIGRPMDISCDLEKALNKTLNDRQRKTILLWLEGYSYEDIARKTGNSETSVRGLIFRARKILRAYLEVYKHFPRLA